MIDSIVANQIRRTLCKLITLLARLSKQDALLSLIVDHPVRSSEKLTMIIKPPPTLLFPQSPQLGPKCSALG